MLDSASVMDRVKRLESVKGIQRLLNEASEIFENPILLHDMEYKVIKLSQNIETDDPIWVEYAANGTVGEDWLLFFKNECFIETAANAKKITFLTSDKLKYNRIFGKLFNKNNIQIGCACMVACNRLFEDEDIEAFDELCTVLSNELGRSKFFNDYGQVYLEKLVGELISGISDKELYTAHVESIYMHLQTSLYLAAVDISKCTGEKTGLAYFRDRLRKAQPEYIYAVHDSYILIFLSTDEPALNVEKDLGSINRILRKHNLRMGISGCFDNLFELQAYYNEAIAALHGGETNGGQYISRYER